MVYRPQLPPQWIWHVHNVNKDGLRWDWRWDAWTPEAMLSTHYKRSVRVRATNKSAAHSETRPTFSGPSAKPIFFLLLRECFDWLSILSNFHCHEFKASLACFIWHVISLTSMEACVPFDPVGELRRFSESRPGGDRWPGCDKVNDGDERKNSSSKQIFQGLVKIF